MSFFAMSDIRRKLALSDHWAARLLRKCRHWLKNLGLPSSTALTIPMLSVFLVVRSSYYFLVRVLVCEPLFKAYCTKIGKGVRTGVFVHWVEGRGHLIVGDNVRIDGKCSFTFASRFSAKPALIIGDNTDIGHGCIFTVAKQITIGRNCQISTGVLIFDSPGHPADPIARATGSPPADDEVRPIVIEDNVWIGRRATILPGVTIGRDSIVATGAVVMTDVPPSTLVAGNPARQVRKLAGGIVELGGPRERG
jgi:acetyltransferase-like isoleucine patch superfamily enzyme